MKQVVPLLLTWFTINLSILDEPILKVTRMSTDSQIKQIEQQALQQYSIKAEIRIIKRNNQGEITHLKCTRYAQSGEKKGTCESDNFGAMIIIRGGCKIADLGYEDRM